MSIPHLGRPGRRAHSGFTLLEVMVALIIIAIGALGIAKMQALALSNTGASRSRALASLEAAALASAMHADRAYWSSSASVPGTVTVTTAAGTATLGSSSATMAAALAAVTGTACPTTANMNASLSCYCATGYSAPCSTVNMAANDLYDWGMALGAVLPSATATVTCNTADAPVDCTIALTWVENAVSLNATESTAATANGAAGAAFQQVGYTLYVVP